MDAAVYTRVSTTHEEQFSSIENQQKHYIEYCEKHGYNLVKLYTDEGLSATSPKRKSFLEMIHDSGLDFEKDKDTNEILYFKLSERHPKFNLIITKDVSRFARNTDAIVLARKLKLKGVIVLFENAGFSTDDNDWEMRLSLLLTFSQQESLDRSKKVAFAYKQRSKSGIHHMTRNLFGYEYNSQTKTTSIKEEEAEVVRKMFDLYINHDFGMKNISKYLNENNIKTQNGNMWTAGNVRRLLRNEKYIGRVILNRYTNNGITSENKRIQRPTEEWIIHENAIPAIIDIQTWEKVHEIMGERVQKTSKGSLTGSRKVKNIFYKKLYCGECGAVFVRVTAIKKRKSGKVTEHHYSCANRRHRNTCDNRMISHNVLERKIINFAETELPIVLKTKKELLTASIKAEIQVLHLKKKMSAQQIEETKEKIKSIDSEIDKLLTAFSRSSSTVVSVIEKKIEQLEDDKQVLAEKILEYDVLHLENEIENLENILQQMNTIIKKKYSFEDALNYIGKITAHEKEIKFDVVVNKRLEPYLNPDITRIGKGNIEKALSEIKETIDEIKKLANE